MTMDKNSNNEIGELSELIDSLIQHNNKALVEIKEKENTIIKKYNIMLQFSEGTEKYVVGLIDIVNSTSICSNLSDREVSEFYQIFINSMNEVVKKFGGIVPKNIGDSVLFYFPIDVTDEKAILEECLQCCIALRSEHKFIATKLEERNLPSLDYRISSTYGTGRTAKSSTSTVDDIFGTTVNKCAKLNHSAKTNGIIIGRNFYKVVKDFKKYTFKEMDEKIITEDYVYSGYHLLS